MALYVIGIGGTGAKCVEALVHVSAAGALGVPLEILMVDPDEANGSLERTLQTIRTYRESHSAITSGAIPFLRTTIKTTSPPLWSPFNGDSQPTLEKLVGYESMEQTSKGLVDVLYTKGEQETPLTKGFLGHPSIGAAALADSIDLSQEPWRSFCGKIRNESQAKILLMGSVFGGTGAAGIPTIARLLAENMRELGERGPQIGCVLMLPYFSFPPSDEDSHMQAHSEEFVLRSQTALEYYNILTSQTQTEIYKAIYLLGSNDTAYIGENNLGSRQQRNPSHYLELYAATAALNFYSHPPFDESKVFIVAREKNPELRWESIPGGRLGGDLRTRLASLARFSYGYLGGFYERLRNHYDGSRELDRVNWFFNFFEREGISEDYKLPLERLASYCESYLFWLKDIHNFRDASVTVNLFNTNVYRVENNANPSRSSRKIFIEGDQLGRIYPFISRGSPTSFRDLSRKLDGYRPRNCREANGFGRFVYALYDISQVEN